MCACCVLLYCTFDVRYCWLLTMFSFALIYTCPAAAHHRLRRRLSVPGHRRGEGEGRGTQAEGDPTKDRGEEDGGEAVEGGQRLVLCPNENGNIK